MTLMISLHLWLLVPNSHKIQLVITIAHREEGLTSSHPRWGSIDSWYLLGEGECVASASLTMRQWMTCEFISPLVQISELLKKSGHKVRRGYGMGVDLREVREKAGVHMIKIHYIHEINKWNNRKKGNHSTFSLSWATGECVEWPYWEL